MTSIRGTLDRGLRKQIAESVFYKTMHRLFYERLTTTGQVMFWIVILSTSVSLFSFQLKAYVLWSGLLSVCLCSIIFARLTRRRLTIDLSVPERVNHGQSFYLKYQVSNVDRRSAWDVRVRYRTPPGFIEDGQVSYIDELNPGATHCFTQHFTAMKRGAYKLDQLIQETRYPFGLWRDIKTHPNTHHLLVYPHYHPLRVFDIPVGKKYQPGGLALTSYLGDSTEFLSTRDFRLGDPIRHIHWRSWARLGKPIVKEYGEEYFCRLALIVDTAVPYENDDQCLEQSISLAAAITDYLSREEYVIDLFAAGPTLYNLQAGRSLAYLNNILDILACLEPTPPSDESFDEMVAALKAQLEGISTTILLFTDWDEPRARMLEELQHSGTTVRGFFISRDAELAGRLPETVQWLEPELIEGGLDEL